MARLLPALILCLGLPLAAAAQPTATTNDPLAQLKMQADQAQQQGDYEGCPPGINFKTGDHVGNQQEQCRGEYQVHGKFHQGKFKHGYCVSVVGGCFPIVADFVGA